MTGGEAVPAVQRDSGGIIGYAAGDADTGAWIWGSYLHGIFDDDIFRRWFLDGLRARKGLPGLGSVMAPYDMEPALNRLADTPALVFGSGEDIPDAWPGYGIRLMIEPYCRGCA